MTPAELAAMRALRDCRVIRAHPESPGFGGLRRKALAVSNAVPGSHKRDFKLSGLGWAKAARLPSIITGRNYP